MKDLALYIYKKYGLKLSKEELDEVVKWFEDNSDILVNEEITDKKAREYLYNRFKGRPINLVEEDLSSLKQLLSLLTKESKGK
ncbi:hypothetical protein [Clostridium perfringens]|uniref:hypothetical protein n=1 Tax=Clostridium perfringens TaxID=1502 RepID=UPI0039EC0438